MEQNTTHSMDLANSFGRGSAILCSVAAAYVGMLAVILRLGLNDTWISCALPIVGISWLILNGPVLFNERMAQDRPSLLWGTCFQTFFWLLGIIAFCRLGGVYAGAFCAIAGAICFGVNLSQFIHQDAKCARRTLFACGVLSGIACSGLSWGRGFLSPVFDEGLARGFAYKDTLFHMSISNMIRTHDTASTGLDGVLGISYHWGSHFAISALADGISATALQAYNLIFPVVFGPLFIHSLLLAGIACGGHRCRFSRDHLLGGLIALWALVMVAVVGFLPSPIGNEVGLRPSFMISESMATALIVLALGIGTIFPRLCRTAAFSLVPSANNTSKTWWAGLLFPLFAGALGVSKISLLILCGATVFWVLIRTPSIWKSLSALGSLCLTLVIALLVLRYCYGNQEGASRIDPFHYLTEWVSGIHRPFFFPVTLAWFALAFFLRLREMRVNSWRRLVVCFRSRNMIDLELLAVVAGVGYFVSMTIPIDGGSGVYFHNVQQWIAVVIVLGVMMRHQGDIQHRFSTLGDSWWAKMTRPWGDAKIPVRVAKALAIVFLINVTINNVRLARKITNSRFGSGKVATLLSKGEPIEVSVRKQTLMEAFDYLYAGLSREQKRSTALWIPKSNSLYWEHLGESENALAIPFLAPALTGMAMIDGAPDPHPTIQWKNYGFSQYRIYDKQPLRLDGPALDMHIRQRALEKGFKRVLKIDAEEDSVLITEWQLEAVDPLLLAENHFGHADGKRRIGNHANGDPGTKLR